MESNSIDIVITYLDGNDLDWQKQRNSFVAGDKADINPNRYRNWDNLKYWFRGIEMNAPWVRYIHFVTWGHYPEWLNTHHPKLRIVKHDDYIPKEWLPTFSSRCIDMNLHRIPELAEHFVYFNDDMFLVNQTESSDFFVNGLPCDTAIITTSGYRMKNDISDLHLAPIIDASVINKYFDKKEVISRNKNKWYNLKYGKLNLITLLMFPYSNFVGFMNFHLPYSYNKKTYEEVWNKENKICSATCSHKFREVNDLNHWLFTYWQYAQGSFVPRSPNMGKCFQLHTYEDAVNAKNSIENRTFKMVCLNDCLNDNEDFERIKICVNSALQEMFPEMSSYELPERSK